MPKRRLQPAEESKLTKCLTVRGASERAVQEIWNICHDDDNTLSRGAFERHVERDSRPWLDVTETVKFPCHDGSDVTLTIVDLRRYLVKMCNDAPAWNSAMQTALQQNVALSPVLFCDESTSGNVLAVNKDRKCNLYHISWIELWHLLKNQNAWVPLAIVQSVCLAKIKGGASAVMIEVMKRALSSQNAEGFALGDMMFRQKRKARFLADLEAVRGVYSLKGSAGLRCCILCRNVLKKGSGVPEHDGYFVEISSAGGFVAANDTDVFHQCDMMKHPCTKAKLEEQEVSTGITFDPDSLMWSPMRSWMPPSQILYDYMHLYLCNGIGSWEVILFLNQVYACTELDRASLQTAVLESEWTGTKSSGKTSTYLKNLFAERMFGENVYKGQAHQTGAIVPLLNYYMTELFEPSLPEAVCKSFHYLSAIISFVRKMQHGLHAVDDAMAKHLDKLQRLHHIHFGKAYSDVEYRPKHHHRHHLPLQWRKTGVAMSCESLESKHSLYKTGIGDNQRSLVHDHARFSASVLTKMLKANCSLINKTGLPFWELLSPIKEASFENKLLFRTTELQTSKSSWL
eukprot:s1908_g6.t1